MYNCTWIGRELYILSLLRKYSHIFSMNNVNNVNNVNVLEIHLWNDVECFIKKCSLGIMWMFWKNIFVLILNVL